MYVVFLLTTVYVILPLRYDLIDKPGVLGNYHCLYDLSVFVEGLERPKVRIICIGCILSAGIVPPLNINATRHLSIKAYLKWYFDIHKTISLSHICATAAHPICVKNTDLPCIKG